jgi:hypothetical protein
VRHVGASLARLPQGEEARPRVPGRDWRAILVRPDRGAALCRHPTGNSGTLLWRTSASPEGEPMIQNEHQLRVTQGQIKRFESALAERERRNDDDAPALVRKAREAALRSQLESLRAEAEAYAALRSGRGGRTRPRASATRPVS